MKNTLRHILPGIACGYIIFCALYSISTRFMPTAILCEGPAADILYKTVILGGGILALLFLPLLKDTLRPDAQLFLLGIFVLILAISALLNFQYEFTGNVLGLLTFVCQLIVFYLLPVIMTKAQITRCLKLTAVFTSFFWAIGCTASLYQYIKNIHYTTISPENHRIRQGIVDGRLFGLFSDPNFAAFTSLLIVLLLVYTIRHTRIRLLKIYSFACILINLCYLIMSNSRTIYLATVFTILSAVFLVTYNSWRADGGRNLRTFAATVSKRLLLSLAGIVCVYALIFFPFREIGQILEPERGVNDMIREDIVADNITNNRSTIWKNYLCLYRDKPVFGFSMRSALPYVSDRYPDSYLAQTQYVTHNGYLSLLIETGFTGFAVMGAFFVRIFLQSFKRFRQKETVSESYLFFATLTISVLIFLVCFHDIFFTVNIETMLLYIAIGYIHAEDQTSSLINARH